MPGPVVALEVRASELAAFTYQLNCLAGKFTCSDQAFRELWQNELHLSKDDEAAIRAWGEIVAKYDQSFALAPAPTDYPLNFPDAYELSYKLYLASFLASTPAEFGRYLSLLVTPSDHDALLAIVGRLLPRFHVWWDRVGSPASTKLANNYADVVQKAGLAELAGRVARFYEADIPKDPVRIYIVLRPKTREEQKTGEVHTNALQYENVSPVEALPGEPPEQRLDVIFHELFHYFYSLAPRAKHLALKNAFLAAPESNAPGLYTIFDEAVATALGNGLVAKRLMPADAFAKMSAKPNALYSERFINEAAMAILPVVEERLAKGPSLFDGFATESIRLANARLGEDKDSPLLQMKTRAIAYQTPELEESARRFARSFRGISTSIFPTTDTGEFLRYSERSTAVFVDAGKLDELTLPQGWMTPVAQDEVRSAAKKFRAFIYAMPRTAKAAVYLFVAESPPEQEQLIKAFKGNARPLSGLGFSMAKPSTSSIE